MHKKPSVSWVHRIYWHIPTSAMSKLSQASQLLGSLGTSYASSVNVPACQIWCSSSGRDDKTYSNVSGNKSPFIKKESHRRNGLVHPNHVLVLPVLFCRSKGTHRTSSRCQEMMKKWKTSPQQFDFQSTQCPTLPSDINKRQLCICRYNLASEGRMFARSLLW